MIKPIITIHNAETGEIIVREMNAQELAQYQIDIEKDAQRKVEDETKAANKAALLERLGITADEAALLLS
jgi:hypothetical protein